MQLTLSVDSQSFTEKPTKQDCGFISKRILNNQRFVSMEELREIITNGQTVVCAHFNPHAVSGKFIRNCELFKQSNLVMIDLDEGLPTHWVHIPNFLYKTFSYTPETPKYRAGYVLSETVTNREQYRAIVSELISSADSTADAMCKDSSRIFFAGRDFEVLHLSPLALAQLALPIEKEQKVYTSVSAPADGDETQQKLVFAKMKPKQRVQEIAYLKSKIDFLKTFDESSGGSRYEAIFKTTLILCTKPYMIPSVAAQWVREACETNSYLTTHYDRDFREIVESAFEYAMKKREV